MRHASVTRRTKIQNQASRTTLYAESESPRKQPTDLVFPTLKGKQDNRQKFDRILTTKRGASRRLSRVLKQLRRVARTPPEHQRSQAHQPMRARRARPDQKSEAARQRREAVGGKHGRCRVRTCDPLRVKQVLSQLS
ncbi:MAG: hypothetical protein QOD43_1683 [Gaiellaceae bacterium]|nr:hypothetical protein [Gaiellaceae bacterium]